MLERIRIESASVRWPDADRARGRAGAVAAVQRSEGYFVAPKAGCACEQQARK